ncbi:MAG TPA: SDR family NAD(P)-dependent oxidoreductase [Actinoplanes sp.]|nr:SDR family NAD(P)-dependent oxidoreductase [Actinoplanes sp.]
MPKTIVVTGASDGIGLAAARRLKADGHDVVLVGRSPSKTEAAAKELGADYFVADFTNFADVRRLARELSAAYPKIDVLVNNAGGVFGDPARTVDGFEKTLQVNHLSPFLLTNLLLDNIKAANGTVIQTSSVGSKLFGHVDVDDLNNDRKFSPNKAYGDSKLLNILFTKGLHERGISAAAFHPGAVATSFASDSTSAMRHVYGSKVGRMFLISADKGADQLVWLAEGTPGIDWDSGEYYEKKKPARRPNPQVNDEELIARVWDRSADMVGVPAVS